MPRETLVVRARVHARLLGLHLLTLDALVTADDEDRAVRPDARAVVGTTSASYAARVSGGAWQAADPPRAQIGGADPGSGVAQARLLVEQSEDDLQHLARR